MNTTFLLIALCIVTPFTIISTFLMIAFYYRNNRLEKENESLSNQLSKLQALEQSRKLENDEVLQRMFADLEQEELIFLNT